MASQMLQSTVTHVAFAFVVMGGWGVYANLAHPMPEPLVAGFLQGLMSAVLTLFLKKTVDRLRPVFAYVTGFWAPPLIACIGSTSLLVLVHWLGGTPEILRTILVPVTVAISYIAVYNFLRQRESGR